MKPDLTFRTILPNDPHYCRVCINCGLAKISRTDEHGHLVPNQMVLVTGTLLPSKFHGLWCENCVIIARQLAKAQS